MLHYGARIDTPTKAAGQGARWQITAGTIGFPLPELLYGFAHLKFGVFERLGYCQTRTDPWLVDGNLCCHLCMHFC